MKSNCIILPLFVVALGMCSVSCSDDDKKDEPGAGSATELPIPSSIVDGVRITEVPGVLDAEFNTDGSIKAVNYDGEVYRFEYDGSRAASTGRKLARIVMTDTEGDTSWEAYDFRFNNKGFVESYTEVSEEKGYDWWEKSTLKINVSYNGQGQVSSMNVNARTEGYEDGDKYNESAKGKVNYSYSNGCLVKSEVKDREGTISYSFDYTDAPRNRYNLVTPHLASAMGFFSPVASIFAMTGYLGNSSSNLPTTMTYLYQDDEDTEKDVIKMSYEFDDRDRVTTINNFPVFGDVVTGGVAIYINYLD